MRNTQLGRCKGAEFDRRQDGRVVNGGGEWSRDWGPVRQLATMLESGKVEDEETREDRMGTIWFTLARLVMIRGNVGDRSTIRVVAESKSLRNT